MQNKGLYLLVVIVIVFLSGCSSSSSNQVVNEFKSNSSGSDFADGPYFDKQESPDIGKSLIYVMWASLKEDSVPCSPVELYINGKYLTTLKERGIYPIHVSPGKYSLTLDSASIDGDSIRKVEGIIKEGEINYANVTQCIRGIINRRTTGCFNNKKLIEERASGIFAMMVGRKPYYKGLKGAFQTRITGNVGDLKLSLDRDIDIENLILKKEIQEEVSELNKEQDYKDSINGINNNSKVIMGTAIKSSLDSVSMVANSMSKGKQTVSIGSGALQGAGVGIAVGIVGSVINEYRKREGSLHEHFIYKGIKGYYQD